MYTHKAVSVGIVVLSKYSSNCCTINILLYCDPNLLYKKKVNFRRSGAEVRRREAWDVAPLSLSSSPRWPCSPDHEDDGSPPAAPGDEERQEYKHA